MNETELIARALGVVRECPGGPDWECGVEADPGDRYCRPCRDAIERNR